MHDQRPGVIVELELLTADPSDWIVMNYPIRRLPGASFQRVEANFKSANDSQKD